MHEVEGEEGIPEAVAERAAMAADSVPEVYLDAWARLNVQRPAEVSEARWRQALDDGGRLLDRWGAVAAGLRWLPGDLFDVPLGDGTGGVIWQLGGREVEAMGFDRVRCGETYIMRGGDLESLCKLLKYNI